MEDLYAKFLPQFIPVARARVATALKAATEPAEGGTMAIVRELHTLAGEAGLLGLTQIVPLARDCEATAKRLDATGAAKDAEALVATLRELERIIEGIGAGVDAKSG